MNKLKTYALLLVLCALPMHAFAFDLSQLMTMLGKNEAGTVSFVEKKFISNLNQYLESSGTLVFSPPFRLERHTVKPKAESIVLDGEVMTWSRGQTSRQFKLSEYPEFSVLITSVRATLAGDKKTLEQHYLITLDGTASAWKLGLTPQQRSIANKVRHIQIAGAKQFVERIDFALPDGDYSTMTVTKPSGQ